MLDFAQREVTRAEVEALVGPISDWIDGDSVLIERIAVHPLMQILNGHP